MGLLVVVVNEHNTSAKCPRCGHRLFEIEYRTKYCSGCNVLFGRDSAAAENIAYLTLFKANQMERPPHVRPLTLASSGDRFTIDPEEIERNLSTQNFYYKIENITKFFELGYYERVFKKLKVTQRRLGLHYFPKKNY